MEYLTIFLHILQGSSVKYLFGSNNKEIYCCLKKKVWALSTFLAFGSNNKEDYYSFEDKKLLNAQSLEKYAEKSLSTSTWRSLTVFRDIFPGLEREVLAWSAPSAAAFESSKHPSPHVEPGDKIRNHERSLLAPEIMRVFGFEKTEPPSIGFWGFRPSCSCAKTGNQNFVLSSKASPACWWMMLKGATS